jgi:hypothetical protein
MNYDQFVQAGYPRYELFARTVAAILQAAIDAHPQDLRKATGLGLGFSGQLRVAILLLGVGITPTGNRDAGKFAH